jgi:hypothetical protein
MRWLRRERPTYAPAMELIRIVFLLAFAAVPALGAHAQNACGMSPDDWCTKPADGPCGKHLTAQGCRNDKACIGMRYSGESVIACHWDVRGFANNCPTVGCTAK